MKKAVVLLSGGLDSATTLFLAKDEGYKCLCLIFNYGQRHKKEIKSAIKIAKLAKCEYKLLKIKLPWQGSSLLDRKIKIPNFSQRKSMVRLRSPSTLSKVEASIPSTYVPARNLIFLSFATSFAESINASAIFIGANSIDFSGYPDCRPKFYEALKKTIKAGTKSGAQGKNIKIYAPLIKKSKKEIVKLACRLKAPFKFTWSCYRGGKNPCGVCDSCKLREKGFKNAGIKDPLCN